MKIAFSEYKSYKSIEFYFQYKSLKKNIFRVIFEFLYLSISWRCIGYHYFQYEFFTRSNPLTLKEMKSYIPNQIWEKRMKVANKEYEILCHDKVITSQLLSYYQVPQPKMLFKYSEGTFYSPKNEILNDFDVQELIQQQECSKIFVKNIFGTGGKDIYIFQRNKSNEYIDISGQNLNTIFFRNSIKSQNLMAQEGIEQNSKINAIYPNAVNTIRILTKCIYGSPEILGAVIKFGQAGGQVDNCNKGSIVVSIDILNGRLFGIGKTYYNNTIYTKHPDTNFAFDGFQIPLWEETIKVVLSASIQFSSLKYIGWDVAIGTHNPIILELNETPGIHLMQMVLGGKKEWINEIKTK